MQATPKVTRRWHASQWIALGMVAAFLAAGFFAGWPLACLAGVLTSPVYFALKAWRERDAELITPPLRGDLWPFDTFAALRLARIQAGTFRKQPFRMEIENRVIRSARWERFQQAKLCVLQAIAATLLYPFQCFPISKEWNEITPAVE